MRNAPLSEKDSIKLINDSYPGFLNELDSYKKSVEELSKIDYKCYSHQKSYVKHCFDFVVIETIIDFYFNKIDHESDKKLYYNLLSKEGLYDYSEGSLNWDELMNRLKKWNKIKK